MASCDSVLKKDDERFYGPIKRAMYSVQALCMYKKLLGKLIVQKRAEWLRCLGHVLRKKGMEGLALTGGIVGKRDRNINFI